MAVPKFNAKLFQIKKEAQGDGSFPDVASGIYICKLEKCYSKVAASGRLNCCFGWQIDEDDPNYKNQYIWNFIGLTDAAGVDSEDGYNVLAIVLSQLKVKSDAEDLDAILETAIGTKCRIDWTAPSEENQYSKLRIKKLISLPDGSEAVSAYKADQAGNADETTVAAEEQVVEIVPGMIGIHSTGARWEVIAVLEASESDDNQEYVTCKPVGGKLTQMKNIPLIEFTDFQNPEPKGVTQEKPSTPAPAPAATPSANELDNLPEEEGEGEEESVGFTVGQAVTGISAKTGNTINGRYKETAADGLIVVLNHENKIFRLKPESVKPV